MLWFLQKYSIPMLHFCISVYSHSLCLNVKTYAIYIRIIEHTNTVHYSAWFFPWRQWGGYPYFLILYSVQYIYLSHVYWGMRLMKWWTLLFGTFFWNKAYIISSWLLMLYCYMDSILWGEKKCVYGNQDSLDAWWKNVYTLSYILIE